MDYTFEIIITALALSCYGAIRLVIDFLLVTDRIVTKLANSAQTVKKQQVTAIVTREKQDKRHKYTVNVDACREYLASRQK